jgi:DNA (cytosine-5)-methyltransferase 1
MQQTKLKVLDLFSGIGGFSLGLESTGHFETIAFCEKDQFCQKVLQKNFKNILIEGDVRNVKGDKYKADVVTGGFPCQPFSVAGKRKGTDDDRYLWDETIRVVRECKPKWFIGENVEGLINIQEGMVLRQVQTDLEKEGFEVQCLIIPASGIGAWHQRKRIWIIGCNVSNSNKSRSFKEYSSTINRQNKRNGFINESGIRSNENVSNSNTRFGIRENQEIQTRGNTSTNGSKDVSNTFGKLSNGCSSSTRNSSTEFKGVECNKSWNWNEVWSKTERCSKQDREDVPNSRSRNAQSRCVGQKLSFEEIKKGKTTRTAWSNSSQKNRTWWQTQSELCGVPNGVSYELDKDRANRVKSLGNSICPQIARELGKAIIEAENVSDSNLNGHK